MRSLTFDVGKKTGCALLSDSNLSSLHFEFKSYTQYYDKIDQIIKKSSPHVILTSKPCRFYNTIYSHAQYIALIELCAQRYNIPVFLLTDREIKSWAFPKVKKVTKQMVLDKYGGKTEDEADARMFAKFAESNIVEES